MRPEMSTPQPTPWGPIAAVFLCLLPIALLLLTTLLRRLSLPSGTSLPAAAALLAFIRLAYFSCPPVLVAGSVLKGVLEALTPLSVIYGAILLFETMQHTMCLPWMMQRVRSLSAGEPIGEVMLIGWAFAFMISGVGGFNTPIALAAPMLASLGHDPVKSIISVVVFSTLASHYGSVGMSIWFGFNSLDPTHGSLLAVGLKASAILAAISFVVCPIAATYLVGGRQVLRSGLFVMLSIASAVGPMVALAKISTEFPVLLGGISGIACTAALSYFKIGVCNTPACSVTTLPWLPHPPINPPYKSNSWHRLRVVLSNFSLKQLPLGQPVDGIICISDLETPAIAPSASAGSESNLDGGASSSSSSSSSSSRATLHSLDVHSPRAAPIASPLPWQAQQITTSTPNSISLARNSCPAAYDASSILNNSVQQWSRQPQTVYSNVLADMPNFTTSTPVMLPKNLAAALFAATLHHAALDGISRQPWYPTGSRTAAGNPHTRQQRQWQQQQQRSNEQLGYSGTEIPAVEMLDPVNALTDEGGSVQGGSLSDRERECSISEADKDIECPDASNAEDQQQQDGSSGVTQGCVQSLQRFWGSVSEAILKTLPIWLTLLLLLVTRVQQLKIQAILQSTAPSLTLHLGTLGTFSLSPALVIQLQQLLSVPELDWKYEVLYVPCFLPFVVASLVTIAVHKQHMTDVRMGWRTPFCLAWQKLQCTISSMVGAMILSQLISTGGVNSPAYILGYYLSNWLGKGYLAIAGFLGALGTFISGSTMTSNITFGAIQQVAAVNMGVPASTVLAVHVVGSCAGKMMCINNILSVKAMMDVQEMDEGQLMRNTVPVLALFVLLAEAAGLVLGLTGVWPGAA